MTDYLINFVVGLDPNYKRTPLTGLNWPKYTNSSRQLLTFQDGLFPLTLIKDTYRAKAMDLEIEIMLNHPY